MQQTKTQMSGATKQGKTTTKPNPKAKAKANASTSTNADADATIQSPIGTSESLKTDFSITMLSDSTGLLNSTFQLLMDVIQSTEGLSIRGPIRLPKDGKVHSRRVDVKAITERQLRSIAALAGIGLSDTPQKMQPLPNGVLVQFDIE